MSEKTHLKSWSCKNCAVTITSYTAKENVVSGQQIILWTDNDAWPEVVIT